MKLITLLLLFLFLAIDTSTLVQPIFASRYLARVNPTTKIVVILNEDFNDVQQVNKTWIKGQDDQFIVTSDSEDEFESANDTCLAFQSHDDIRSPRTYRQLDKILQPFMLNEIKFGFDMKFANNDNQGKLAPSNCIQKCT